LTTDRLRELSALTALNAMMAKGWLDICTVDAVATMLGRSAKCPAYDVLRPIHCVHFDKMPPELRDAIPGLVHECLGTSPTFQFADLTQRVIDVSPASDAKPAGRVARLLGFKS